VPLSIIVGLIAAAQVARIAATPLPQYAKGGEKKEHGLAIFGEEGRELYRKPSGEFGITPDGPTPMNLPKGTYVWTAQETNKMLQNKTISNLANMGRPINEQVYMQAMIDAEDRNGRNIVEAIKGIKNGIPVYIPVPDYKWNSYISKNTH
jgi:hypothetical protein